MEQIRIGMISFAHGHAYSYLHALRNVPNVTVVGFADSDSARAAAIEREHTLTRYQDHHKLLAAGLDAVIICSENVHHARLTIDAAHAGVHVLCEKPLGVSLIEMKEMIEACEANSVQLMTAFPCRYMPGAREAKDAIDRGEIGELVAFKGFNRGKMPGDWFVNPSLSGGGAILDHTVHVADLMNWFLGSAPVEVHAVSRTLFNDLPVEDSGIVHMKYSGDVVGVLDTSWSRPKSFPVWGDVVIEIIGTQGVIKLDGFAQKNQVFSESNAQTKWLHWGQNMDALLIADFVNAVKSGTPVPITGRDGYHSTKVALAAYESVSSQGPVKLSEY
ncbi:Gfo/Idh/MocA family protein [Paenibacillus nasutitermitis]|uniref:Dehydrogenase n=1 Tax=Paenibacillus nasutitermitis TaxID=1652958 RepID=A0A916YM28_9BACL|nr:Gfo/Idh/MocA family oxidoreductase [Paenibacillus nasutitermitis]GGD51005.1 dehydrogenase [Paenibacillus nasutitermitis]